MENINWRIGSEESKRSLRIEIEIEIKSPSNAHYSLSSSIFAISIPAETLEINIYPIHPSAETNHRSTRSRFPFSATTARLLLEPIDHVSWNADYTLPIHNPRCQPPLLNTSFFRWSHPRRRRRSCLFRPLATPLGIYLLVFHWIELADYEDLCDLGFCFWN